MGSSSALLVLLLCCSLAADSFAFVLRKRSWDAGETNRLSDALEVLQRERRRLEQERDYESLEQDYPSASSEEEEEEKEAEEILRKIFESDLSASSEEEDKKEEKKENEFAEKLLQVLQSEEEGEENISDPSYEFRATPANLNELENILKPSEDEKDEEKKSIMRKRGDTAENMVDDTSDEEKRSDEKKREYDPSVLVDKKSDGDSSLNLNKLTSRDINQLMSEVEADEDAAVSTEVRPEPETVDSAEIADLLNEVEQNESNPETAEEDIPEQPAELVDLNPVSDEDDIPAYPAKETNVNQNWFINKVLDTIPASEKSQEVTKRAKPSTASDDSILQDPELRDLLTRIYLKEQLEDDENTNLANALNLATLSQLRGTNDYLPKQFSYIQKAISDEEALQQVEDIDGSKELGNYVGKRAPASYEIVRKRDSRADENYPVAPPQAQLGRVLPSEYQDNMGQWYDEPVDTGSEELTSEEEELLNPFLRKLIIAYKSGKLNPFLRDLLEKIRSVEGEEGIEPPPKRRVIEDLPEIEAEEEKEAEEEEEEREEEEEVANALADYLTEAQSKQEECPQIERVISDCESALGLKLDAEANNLCQRHEVCYACGSSFEGAQLSRDECDQGFLSEANRLCSDDDRCKEDAAVLFLSMQQRHLHVPYSIRECRAPCLLDFVIGGSTKR